MSDSISPQFESPQAALAEALKRIGSQQALARICGISQGAVSKWVVDSRPCSARFVLTIEAATGVPRHALRPDIYPLKLQAGFANDNCCCACHSRRPAT